MILNFKKGLIAFAGTCILAASLSACAQTGTQRAPGPNAVQQNMGTPGIYGNNVNYTGTQYGNTTGANNYTGMNITDNQDYTMGNGLGGNVTGQQGAPDRQRADNIRRQLINMSGIADANVIVMGNRALVGFRPSGNTGNLNAVKSNITNKVKQIDKTITNVSVSESADIMARMSRLGANVTNNGMVNNFADEFNKLIKGLNTNNR